MKSNAVTQKQIQSIQKDKQERLLIEQTKSVVQSHSSVKTPQTNVAAILPQNHAAAILPQTTEQNHAAAIKIQSQIRGNHIRKMRTKYSYKDVNHHHAAKRIQSLQRGRTARKNQRKRRLVLDSKTGHLTHGQRSEKEKEETTRQNVATTRIQSIQRGRAARRSNAAKGTNRSSKNKNVTPSQVDPLLGHTMDGT